MLSAGLYTFEHEGKLVILICEGYATGATLHATTGHAVIVAFDAPNLLPVAEVIRERFPDAIIIACADNDQWTVKPVKNPGLTRANEVRAAIDALVAMPEFDASLGVANAAGKIKGPSDFNDLMQHEGVDAVRRVIANTLNPPVVVAPAPAEVIPPWEDIPSADGVSVLDAPAGDDLPGMIFMESTPMLPATPGADQVPAAPRKDPRAFDPCAPIAMGSSGDLYAFWTSANKVELIKASDLFKDAGILRLQDLNYWQNYCIAGGVNSSPSAKYDRTMVGNAMMQKAKSVGAICASAVPETVASPAVVDLELNLAMMHAKSSAYSIAQVLMAHSDWKGVVWFNEFAKRIEARSNPPCEGGAGRWTDNHDMRLGAWLSATYGVSVPGARVAEAVGLLAAADSRHPVRDYLNRLVWDGVQRLDLWLTTFAGCEDNIYTRNVGAKTLIGAVARIMKPGEKFDNSRARGRAGAQEVDADQCASTE
ncbi:virulence-associated E family protein [Paraburkholderia fungorum]|uniref:Virulence-associated E family protein n=1 Tax=Paraburkholderia fungorum TaxID=134537 RepID=A0AAU8SZ71_9BURK|nr:VapE domain-containing protein [Paraburkholderia fungorum]AJZ59175.1 virulence-associated E family protein [Paraburkholderia fungorum]